MVSNDGGKNEGGGAGGSVFGIPTTEAQKKWGLIIAIGLGVLVIAGAILKFVVFK